ncbi:MAG: lytic transglycosylase domain-containing protein [Pseudomonadales bacterium]|jgi:soluble lytic murein transglycosylase-like protein|nr:lytic transglycosylase domain-containing protein [Pseudomonadales bacterium]
MKRCHLPALALLWLLGAGVEARTQDGAYPFQACFELASALHAVPLDLLLAVAATESAWDPDARSHADAHGIMQIQWPGTARHLGVRRVAELYNPCLNIDLGARYLRELIDLHEGDETRALAAYNYGPTRIAASPELPAGAQRYVDKVDHHRARIERAGAARRATVEAALGRTLAFDHRLRAERYAAALNGTLEGGTCLVERMEDGRWQVRLEPRPSGLTLADITHLDALGWAAEESRP